MAQSRQDEVHCQLGLEFAVGLFSKCRVELALGPLLRQADSFGRPAVLCLAAPADEELGRAQASAVGPGAAPLGR